MSRVRQEIASVIFQADARKANASMEALQEKANSLNDAITGVKQQIEALGNVAPDHQGLISYQQQLRKLNSDLKDVQKTMSDYMRGVKAADQLWQSYMRGDIEGLSLKAIKAGQNGLRKRMENLSPGNPDDQKTLRAYEEVIKEADLVVNKFKTDAAETIQILRDGGTVSEQAMKKARDGVKSLMETVEEGTQEYREFSQQYEYLAAKVVEFTEAQRRAKGEIVDANDARRAAVRLTREGAEAAAREREAQDAVITAQQKEIEQTRALRLEKEKEIEQTNSQMATNMRLADAAMAERRQMEDDYQASLGAIAAEKRQQAQQQAQAAHDEADQMRANAQLAEQTAQQKRQAYEQETQAVTQLDGEVKKLTEDLHALSAEPVKPKVDTSEIEKLTRTLEREKRDLADIIYDERAANETLKQFGITTADITDEVKLQAAAEKALKIEEESRLELAQQMLAVRKEMGAAPMKDSRIVGTKETQAFYAKNKGILEDEWWKSEAGGGSVSRMYKYLNDISDDPEAKAEFKEQIGVTVKDAMRVAGQRMREVLQEAIKRGFKVDEAMTDFEDGYGHGPAVHIKEYLDEFNEEVEEKEKALIEARRKKLSAITDVVYEPGDEMDSREERLRLAKESLIGEATGHYGTNTPLSEQVKIQQAEVTRLEEEIKKLSQAEKESATTSDEYQRKQAELAAKTEELAQAKQRQAKAEGEMNAAQQQANKAQDDANQKQVEAVQLSEKAAQAEREAATEQERHNEVLQRQDEKIAKLQNDYDALDDTLRKQEGELTAYDQKVAQSEQAIAEAERKKAQARELSAKDMRDAIAALRERNDAIGEANPEWEKNERLIAQYNQRLEEMKQRSAELRGEVMSLSDALSMAGTIDSGGASVEKMEQAIKTLTDAKRKATDPKDFDEYGAAIDKISEKLKEATSEWMSLSRAEEIAQQAGENYYLDNSKKGFFASPEEIQKATAALNRQRETLIKTIQAKKANKEATDAEEKELADLTKKLRDLKFEQDNVNMSQAKMRTLMEAPAEAVSLDELRAAIKRADGELKRMEGSLGANSKQYKAFAEQVKQAKNTMKEMEGAAKANASAWEKAASRLKTYVGLYMGFNMLWQKMVGTAGDLLTLSDKMGEVRKTTQMTADEVGRLSDSLAKLDTRTGLTGLMEFSSLAGSIGLKTQEDVQGFTEAANMLAVSLPELGNEASRTLMKIADATGDLEKNGNNVRETLERVGSTVIALRANSAAAAGPITDFVSRVGAVGAQAGISIDQIAALGATVDALGGRVEMSATALSRMIPAIRNNTFEVAQAIGMTEKQLKSMSGIDQMVAIFKALRDSVKGFDMTTEEGMSAAADAVEGMLGRSTSMQEVMKQLNQQGARAGIVFGLLSQNVDTLEKQLGIAGEAYKQNTALMDEYNKMNDTAAAKWERLKNQIEEFFVSDRMQRMLGDLIDMLRKFTDWFASDGPLATGFKMMIAYAIAMKGQFGAMFMGIGGGLKALSAGFGSFVNVLATGATAAVGNLAGMAKGLRGVRMATIGARREWLKMDAAMKSNIIGAIITALGLLAYKLYDMHRASKEAAAEVGRFNQKMDDERKALSNLFEPLNKSNLAQKDRVDLIRQINSQYGKYLGYMLSETSSAIALADAHALIAKRIKEEAYERRIADKERKIMEEHDEDLNAAYGGIESAVRGGARRNADVQAMADMLKSFADQNLQNVEIKWSGGYRILQDFTKDLNGMLERMAADGKLRHGDIREIEKAVYDYASEAKKQHNDIMSQTSNLRADLRGVQNAIKYDLSNNLNTLISNVASSVSNAVNNANKPQQEVPLMLQGTQGGGGVKLPSLFGGQQSGWQAPWSPQQRETTPDQQMAPEGWKSGINKKDINQVRQVVESQEAIRSMLQTSGEQLSEAQRKVAESWKLTDEELKEYKAIVEKADRAPGGSKANPYGDYDKVKSAYSEWNGNDLVARRKEMLERVKALANGADVQAVLSEDAKFISDAVRKNIKTTEQAIEWYNTERLKIQDALHAKHLTNTGDWLDPKNVAKRFGRTVKDEMKYYMDELDAYYTERNQEIQQKRNDEEITEGEAWRQTIQNETEWYQRRAKLQKLYADRSKEVTQDEQDAIFNIISERTGETVKFIKADVAQTWKLIEDVGKKSKAAMDRIKGDLDLGVEKDTLKSAKAVGKSVKFMADTLAKERPLNGIVEDLELTLTKMGVLEGQVPEKMRVLIGEIENAYSTDVKGLVKRISEAGFTEWAKQIEGDTTMQQALMAQLRKAYEAVQEQIRKEASRIKKDADMMWKTILLPDGTNLKQATDEALARMTQQQDSLGRANSLIGAGVASDNVATKLAVKQLQLQMSIQRAQFALMRKMGDEKARYLDQLAKEYELAGDLAKAERARKDAANVRKSLELAVTEETKKQEELSNQIAKEQEEAQARLYKELREWGDLIASSLQSVFEASNAGNAEYYNELAKLNLTGKGGPGAGTYIVIENEGTEDAKAHYEYLDERQALERQHEIEQQNAQADAWKKVMDDLNQKMSDTITDQLNAALQEAATRDNTAALMANTDAIYASMGVKSSDGSAPAQVSVQLTPSETGGSGFAADKANGYPSAPSEPVVTDQANTDATNANTSALNTLTQVITGQPVAAPADMGAVTGGGLTDPASTADGEAQLAKPFFQMTEEETAQAMDRIQQLWQAYNEGGVTALQEMASTLAGQEGIVLPPWQITEEGLATAMERMQQLWTAYAEQGIEALQMMSDAMEEMPNKAPDITNMTEEQVEAGVENANVLYQGFAAASGIATDAIIKNKQKEGKTTQDVNKQEEKSTGNFYAKMTQAANLYGVAYQAMSNDNLSASQKFQTIALQAAGNAAIAAMTATYSKDMTQTTTSLPVILAECLKISPIAGAAIFAALTAVLGGLMGMAASKLAKGKQEIAQVTGSSASAGRLSTGMLTYAEGNVNEMTDPSTLTTGRHYNVDGADGRTYRAKYMGKDAKTHITTGPEFHLVGEKGREAIIDAHTTRKIQMNDPEIWHTIQTLYNGGSMSMIRSRRGRGVRTFAEGNLEDFEDISDSGIEGGGMGDSGMAMEQMLAFQQSLDANTAVMQRLADEGIEAFVSPYGKRGIVNGYDTYKKEAERHGVKYQ